MKLFPMPYTTPNDDEVVVFLIGMRFNGVRGIGHAIRTAISMPRMLASLERDRSKGMLAANVAFGWPVAYVIQYWSSYEALERFAKAPEDEHLPMWRWYNRLGREARDVGVWHETFRVAAGAYESIYVNMPCFGLARALGHVPVTQARRSSRERMTAQAGSPAI